MRLLVCGGRNYDDYTALAGVLDGIAKQYDMNSDDVVIHGAARGADTLADRWATEKGIATLAIPAQWKKHGKAAGPIRNSEMLEYDPDLVVAFPGGRGTADMVKKALAKDIQTFMVNGG